MSRFSNWDIKQAYEPTSHAPIYINGNSDFTSANGVTSGDGTAGNPYIIKNWNINASVAHGIRIFNTTAYFIIKKCVVHDGYEIGVRWNYGIYFYNVTNGKIDNVSSYNNFYGIYLDWHSSNNIISNCAVYSNDHYGICLFSSSNNNTISNCVVYGNSYYSIYLGSSSNNNIISNCAVYNNSQYGILLSSSSNNNITNCTVYNNNYGIAVQYSSNNEIHYSNIYGNTNYGVYNFSSETIYQVDATYCWWSSVNGPGMDGANPVSGNVLYEPWLTESYMTSTPPELPPINLGWESIKEWVVDSWDHKTGMDSIDSLSFSLSPEAKTDFSFSPSEKNQWIQLLINNKTIGVFKVISIDDSDSKSGSTIKVKTNGVLSELKKTHHYVRGKKDVDYAENMIQTEPDGTLFSYENLFKLIYQPGSDYDGKNFSKHKLLKDWVLNGVNNFDILKKIVDNHNEQFFLDYSGFTESSSIIRLVVQMDWVKADELVGEKNHFIYGKNILDSRVTKTVKDFANKIILNWGEKEYPKTIIEQDDESIGKIGVYEYPENKTFKSGEEAINYAHRLLLNKTRSVWTGSVDVVFDDEIDFGKLAKVTDARQNLDNEIFKIKSFSLTVGEAGTRCSLSLDNEFLTIGEIFAKQTITEKEDEEETLVLDKPIFLKDKIRIGLKSFSFINFPPEDFEDGHRVGRFDIDDYSTSENPVYYGTGAS